MAAHRWVDGLVTCGLTACTPGSAPGPTLGKAGILRRRHRHPHPREDPRRLARHADFPVKTLARMSARMSVSVSASWNASLTSIGKPLMSVPVVSCCMSSSMSDCCACCCCCWWCWSLQTCSVNVRHRRVVHKLVCPLGRSASINIELQTTCMDCLGL